MDPRHEKRTKQRQDVAKTSKRGHSCKAPTAHGPPPPFHHPSHSSDEEEDDREMFEWHSPIERSSYMALCYSKKVKQSNVNDNREAPVTLAFGHSFTQIGTSPSISTN
jgi:hypothetical protein